MELQLSNDEGDEAIAIAKYCHEHQWIHNPNGSIDFKEGRIFGNVKLVRKPIKNDRSRYTVKCKNETCDWRFHASCLPDGLTFMIRKKYAIKCDSQTIYRAKKRVLKNLKVDHVNSYAKLWAASRVGYATRFKEVIESIKDDSARHTFDPRIKSDYNTNNMSECFNSWIKDDRDKSVLTLMEFLRRKVMVRFHEKWEVVEKFYGILPYIRGRINDNDKEGRKLHVIHGKGLWEISGIPCKHALAAFSFNRQFAHESVHWYYSNEALKLTYGGNINPVPEKHRKIGRQKKNRRREANEGLAPSKKFSTKCRNCGGLGHNKRTCTQQQPTAKMMENRGKNLWNLS
ncbi:hypothetical protein ACOSP7_024370 [Xanthoceras sorbifolium]